MQTLSAWFADELERHVSKDKSSDIPGGGHIIIKIPT